MFSDNRFLFFKTIVKPLVYIEYLDLVTIDQTGFEMSIGRQFLN